MKNKGSNHTGKVVAAFFAVLLVVVGGTGANAQIVLGDGNYTYTQNFTSLTYGVNRPWVDNTTLLGWYYAPTFGAGSNTNVVYQWTTGGNGTAGLQFYTNSSVSPTIRGLGSLTNAGLENGYFVPQVLYGFQIQNGGDMTITEITLSFDQLQWYGGTGAANDTILFSYSLSATSLSSGAWTSVSDLNLGNFINGTGAITLQTTSRTATITGLEIAPGESIWFRWQDNDVTGGDAGAGITNLKLTAVPEPQTFVLSSIGLLMVLTRMRKRVNG